MDGVGGAVEVYMVIWGNRLLVTDKDYNFRESDGDKYLVNHN